MSNTTSFELGDILEAVKAWEGYRLSWETKCLEARQPKPSEQAMDNFRAIWLEGWLLGNKRRNADL